jgi:predicted NUDIX family NTP pyrophosphohydrolase
VAATTQGRLGTVAGRRSAGILVFRRVGAEVEVLLGHMGGPLWARRDTSAWSIPKGEYQPDEEPEAAARREFEEELGFPLPPGVLHELGTIRQAGGKVVTAWAIEADPDLGRLDPGTFTMEWPPRSGQMRAFPEIDRVAWFGLQVAREKIVTGQRVLLERLMDAIGRIPT